MRIPSAALTVVEVTDLHRSYQMGSETIRAVNGVSLEIEAGEYVAIVGPSGCGKSTLLNMIAGLDRPTAGTIRIHGDDLGRLDERKLALFRRHKIGMIFQFFNLLDDLPALDNVALAAQLTGSRAGVARQRALELLDELGIADRRNAYPAALSGGERQRGAVGTGQYCESVPMRFEYRSAARNAIELSERSTAQNAVRIPRSGSTAASGAPSSRVPRNARSPYVSGMKSEMVWIHDGMTLVG